MVIQNMQYYQSPRKFNSTIYEALACQLDDCKSIYHDKYQALVKMWSLESSVVVVAMQRDTAISENSQTNSYNVTVHQKNIYFKVLYQTLNSLASTHQTFHHDLCMCVHCLCAYTEISSFIKITFLLNQRPTILWYDFILHIYIPKKLHHQIIIMR